MHDTNKIIYEFFSDDDFLKISEAVKKAEKSTSAEIKVGIKAKRNFSEKKKTLHELAAHEFDRLKMSRTKDAVGVLIFLLLTERKFYVFADKGINEKIDLKTWEEIRNKMQAEFVRGRFTEGIILGINEAAKILAERFPISPDDVNELSDSVALD